MQNSLKFKRFDLGSLQVDKYLSSLRSKPKNRGRHHPDLCHTLTIQSYFSAITRLNGYQLFLHPKLSKYFPISVTPISAILIIAVIKGKGDRFNITLYTKIPYSSSLNSNLLYLRNILSLTILRYF